MFRKLLPDEKRCITPELYYHATRTDQHPLGVCIPSILQMDRRPRSRDLNPAGERAETAWVWLPAWNKARE